MSKSLTLYEMTQDLQRYLDAETDEELASALADITADQIQVKSESYCHFFANLDSAIDMFKAEEKRIAAARKAMENKLARVKERMKECLEAAGIASLNAGTWKVSIAKNPPALKCNDPELTPASFKIIIPETWQADNARIKVALKAGEDVAGYELTVGTSLRIK